MAPSLFRRRAETASQDEPPPAPRRAVPPASELRRERRALLQAREERIRDLGGLAFEMYRRDSFREHLLYEQCTEIAGIDERLLELDALLEHRRPPAARCTCGAVLVWGSRFCANCGRQVSGRPLAACAACGHALPADARFCPACATPADADAPSPAAGRSPAQRTAR